MLGIGTVSHHLPRVLSPPCCRLRISFMCHLMPGSCILGCKVIQTWQEWFPSNVASLLSEHGLSPHRSEMGIWICSVFQRVLGWDFLLIGPMSPKYFQIPLSSFKNTAAISTIFQVHFQCVFNLTTTSDPQRTSGFLGMTEWTCKEEPR